MPIKDQFLRYFLLPAGMQLNGLCYRKVKKYASHLTANERHDPGLVADARNFRFQNLIQYCYDRVPYYHQQMDTLGLQVKDFRTIDDIIHLPILDKKILVQNQEFLRATHFGAKNIRIEHTGGSTGRPTPFAIDKKSYYQVYANAWRFWSYAGYKHGMKMLLFWGNRTDLERLKSLKRRLKSFVENTIVLSIYDFSKERVTEYVRLISRWQPAVIRGYSGAIYMFVEFCKKYQVQLTYHPHAIIITSENILDSQKNRISDFFQCEVFEEYGSREFGILAHECEAHHGLHLAEEQFIFEIYDPVTNQSNFEGHGELLISSLFNYGMPLLRYRIEDEGTISSLRCACGRSLKVLKKINGRIIDYIVTNDGKLIHQWIFESFFDSEPGISSFQIRQYKKGEVTIFLVLNENFTLQQVDKIKAEIQFMFRSELSVTIEMVDKIDLLPSGKRQITLSHIVHDYLPTVEKFNVQK